jgi:hypothetical protein
VRPALSAFNLPLSDRAIVALTKPRQQAVLVDASSSTGRVFTMCIYPSGVGWLESEAVLSSFLPGMWM